VPVDLRELLATSNAISVHTPLTPETENLIGLKELELMKPGVRLINCARGGIYNEAALVEGLKSKKLGGVALDVYTTEPCTDSPLFGMPNVLCTPHLGASTEEAQTLVAVEAVQLLVNYLTTGEVRHAVNMTPIDPKTLAALRGYINLAYRLGLLLAQGHTSGGVEACHLTYRGEVTGKNTKLLTAAFCAGLMERAFDEDVNIVNAEVLLKERGIKVTEELRSEPGAFSSAMTAEVRGGGKSHIAAGTLFGADMPRLIRLNDFRLEAYLDGNLLIFTHNDVPGIIGVVGTIFGRHHVNIGQMSVGRISAKQGGQAVGILNLDAVPSPEVLKEVSSHPDIQSVKMIELPAADKLPRWLT
jgi:D-3-phosphoglycerate dehydrogenase